MEARENDPESMFPLTDAEIDERFQESKRAAERMGLKIPGLTIPLISE